MSDDDAPTDDSAPDEVVERFDSGASIEIDITRVTGTRNQENFKLKGKGRNAEEALTELKDMLTDVEENLAERVRELDVEHNDEPTDDDLQSFNVLEEEEDKPTDDDDTDDEEDAAEGLGELFG